MLLHRSRVLCLGIMAVALMACDTPPAGDAAATRRDVQLEEKWRAWLERQTKQDCVPGPYDEDAMQAVQRAHVGDKRQWVHGSADPYNRRAMVLQNLIAVLN